MNEWKGFYSIQVLDFEFRRQESIGRSGNSSRRSIAKRKLEVPCVVSCRVIGLQEVSVQGLSGTDLCIDHITAIFPTYDLPLECVHCQGLQTGHNIIVSVGNSIVHYVGLEMGAGQSVVQFQCDLQRCAFGHIGQ